MKDGEIVYCNLHLKRKNGLVVQIKGCIFSKPYNEERTELNYKNSNDRRLINQTKLKENFKIEKIEIIKTLGFKHKSEYFTKVTKKQDTFRNVMGGYD